jgi:hypothetical protein
VDFADPTGFAKSPLSPALPSHYNQQFQNPQRASTSYSRMTEGTISLNGEEVVPPLPPIRPRNNPSATFDTRPSTQPQRPSIAELRQERWEAAKSGMKKAALDLMADSFGFGLSDLAKLGLEPLAPPPPAATGDVIRDLEVSESFEGGEIVTHTVSLAVSLVPIGEIAQAAQHVVKRLVPSIPVFLPTATGFGAVVRPPAARLPKYHEHHVFPQQFEREFGTLTSSSGRKAGIRVHEHTIRISARKHYQLHRDGVYNWEWQEFFYGEGAKPTAEGALDLALDLLHQHNVVGSRTLTRHFSRFYSP